MYQSLNRESLLTKYTRIIIVVGIYWITSIFTVFVNKALLSSDEFKLDAPLFITWFQCVVSALICFSFSCAAQWFPSYVSFPNGNPLDRNIVKQVLPLSIMFTMMIASNNLCLKYVGVAFYYVSRSLTTVFNVIFSYIILRQSTSLNAILCCGLIIVGFWLGVDQESITESFSMTGTIFGVIASVSLSLFSIFTKKTLPYVNNEIWLLSYYNNVYSVVLFLPVLVISGELSVVANYDQLTSTWFWCAMSIGGVCGLAIGFVTALQIQVTSPLTHNISGTAKACTQTVIATHMYSEAKTGLWWCSNGVVLVGSALYARVKQMEMEHNHQKDQISQKI